MAETAKDPMFTLRPDRGPIFHELKAWPQPFGEIVRGEKTWELRLANRDFRAGDWLHLREWEPELVNRGLPSPVRGRYTGQELDVVVTAVMYGASSEWTPHEPWRQAVSDRHCVLGIRFPTEAEREAFPHRIPTDHEPVHQWFELSYAQYLTIPRSVLQSMPLSWQRLFTWCLRELDRLMDWRPKEGRYYVYLRGRGGRFMEDPLGDVDP